MEKIIEQGIESHEGMINRIVLERFGEVPKNIERMTLGICNEVYDVVLAEREIIARLSAEDYFLKGSSKHIPMLKELGLVVPEILGENYAKKEVPYGYQFLSKLPGKDLGYVIEGLSDAELGLIAKQISNVFDRTRTIPASENFGLVFGEYTDFSDSWTERMRIWIAETIERGTQTGVMNEKWQSILEDLFKEYSDYFDQIRPTTYLGDICSKNVMIEDGKFVGLVDLDGLTQGDPLESIGRIKASWPGTHYGKVYAEAVMDAQGLDVEQRKMVSVYALLNRISWATENGIQFNQNTKAVVDEEKLKRDTEAIDILLEGCYEFN
jgi:hypothetical protein